LSAKDVVQPKGGEDPTGQDVVKPKGGGDLSGKGA
jgi:hypothetical protein